MPAAVFCLCAALLGIFGGMAEGGSNPRLPTITGTGATAFSHSCYDDASCN